MTKKGKIFLALFAFIAFFAQKSQAQMETIRGYIFVSDSVAGFDEIAASARAMANASYGDEYKVFMYHAKRNYIKQKYNLKTPAPLQPVVTLFNNPLVSKTAALAAACDNEDFELATAQISAPSAVQGWLCQSGSNSGAGCGPLTINNNLNYTVYVGQGIDPVSGLLVQSYFDGATNATPSGNAFMRLNDASAGSKFARVTKTFIVTPSNALFQYAYFPVIEDGSHDCCSQSGFDIKLTVTNTVTNASTLLACPNISVAVPSAACVFTLPANAPVFTSTVLTAGPNAGSWLFHNWAESAIDLTAYINSQISIQITVKDCDQGGHASYCYFDAKCSPMTVTGNDIPFPAGTPSINLPTCGLLGATICAPDGMGPYSWAGQGVIAPYNAPLLTNQCYSTGINADFTLTMNPPGSCNPIERVITVTITPAPYLVASVVQPVCGSPTAQVSYSALGSASVNPVISFSPVPTSTAQTASNIGTAIFPAGTGVVTVQALDPLGCRATATVNINSSPPNVTVAIQNVNGSNSITCITPTIELAAISGYTYGSLTYYWSSSSFTNANQSIFVTSPSTMISVLATDPVTGCFATATIAIGLNQTAPSSSVGPTNQSIICGPGVVATATGTALSPTINVTHSWYVPNLDVPVQGGGQYSIFNPPVGTSTYVLTDNVNGCSTTRTLQVVSSAGAYPSFALTSVRNFTMGCATRSLTMFEIDSPDTSPSGGAMSFTVLPPGFSAPNYTYGIALGYTFSVPGNYTVIVRDNNNQCETRITLPLIQNTFAPSADVVAIPRILTCFTPTVRLEGSSTATPVAFSWAYNNNGNPNTVLNSSIMAQTNGSTAITATVVNNFSLTVTNTINECKTTTIVPIYQNIRPPRAVINGAGAIDCLNNQLQTLANGSTKDAAPGFFSPLGTAAVKWYGPSPQIEADTVAFYVARTVGTYTMFVMDRNNGCVTFTTATVADNRIYPVLLTQTTTALDCGAAGVGLSVTAVGLKAADVTASWVMPFPTPNVKGANTLTLTTDGVGEYVLSAVTNSNGCGSRIRVQVTNGSLTANFNPDQETGFAPLTVVFNNNSTSTSSVTGTSSITTVWSFGNGTTRTTTTNISTSAVYTQPGTYTVTTFSRKGACLDTVKKVIFVDIPSKLVIPNVFTPNGDNSNDVFFIKAANLSEISAIIYDRWGNKVYELTTDKGNIAWDGKNMTGKDAPDGTYFYIITAKGKDGQDYDSKGNVSLYR